MFQIKKFYKNKIVLITGHTGFKGSWLSIWLNSMGAIVHGISLKEKKLSMFAKCDLNKIYGKRNYYLDIKNYNKLKKKILNIKPEIIFHLAAQPIVKNSYDDPINTFETNILGTANILDISRKLKTIKSIIVITTDKCYDNIKKTGYKETDKLGGDDPYSASKACTEIISKCTYESFFKKKKIQLSTARAGNVIGGGDYSNKRLIPDVVKSLYKKNTLLIRNPNQVRPWQHVLDPLHGYLILGSKNKRFSGSWNFGPKSKNIRVIDFVKIFQKNFLIKIKKKIKKEYFKETNILNLNIDKSKNYLKWMPKLTIKETAKLTADWYNYSFKKRKVNLLEFTMNQIKYYEHLVNRL
jgi:CDP-glucose 4,6-dehydratase